MSAFRFGNWRCLLFRFETAFSLSNRDAHVILLILSSPSKVCNCRAFAFLCSFSFHLRLLLRDESLLVLLRGSHVDDAILTAHGCSLSLSSLGCIDAWLRVSAGITDCSVFSDSPNSARLLSKRFLRCLEVYLLLILTLFTATE